jgi:hypothetical protein
MESKIEVGRARLRLVPADLTGEGSKVSELAAWLLLPDQRGNRGANGARAGQT